VKLTSGRTTETFTPPTGKMGYGNVDNTLALAEASLAEEGHHQSDPAQLEAAVMDITRMRADGKGWGQIADAKGFKLGEVKRPDTSQGGASGEAGKRGKAGKTGAARETAPSEVSAQWPESLRRFCAGVLLACAAQAQESPLTLGAGLHYSSGDYGTGSTTAHHFARRHGAL
jgi:hypothetical protein